MEKIIIRVISVKKLTNGYLLLNRLYMVIFSLF